MRNRKFAPTAIVAAVVIILLILKWQANEAISSLVDDMNSLIKVTGARIGSAMDAGSRSGGSCKLDMNSTEENIETSGKTAISKMFTVEEFDQEEMGYKKWVYSKKGYRSVVKGSVLVATTIANENAFGNGRSFEDFYDVIRTLEYPKSSMNLAFYCGSATLLDSVKSFLDHKTRDDTFPYNKVTLLYAPFLQTGFKSSEHKESLQRVRRRSIAQGRNFVTINGLEEEQYLLFLDADVIKFDHTDMLRRFVHSDKDVIVPRITRGTGINYDRNSWSGSRAVPTSEQLALMDQGKWDEAGYSPGDGRTEVFHLCDHVREVEKLPETDPKRDLSYLVDLDSVGGAVLFSKSILFRQGVVFPTLNIVGTAWTRTEGYDGVETEGLCYMAQTLGYKCYAMPNLVAQHYN